MSPDVRRPIDRILLLAALTLMALGMVWIYSASAGQKTATAFVFRQLVGGGVGIVLMLTLSQVPLAPLRENPRAILVALGMLVLLLVAVFFFPARNHAHRWVSLGQFSLQPSELFKPVSVMLVAWWMVKHQDAWQRRQDAIPKLVTLLGILVLPLGLILKQPDFGTSFLILFVAMLIVFLGGAPRWIFAAALPVLAVVGFIFVRMEPYRWARVTSFLNPEADPLGKGHQALQSLIAVGNGGIAGVGLGAGRQKLFYLPEAHNDFIFAVIAEEGGLLATLVILALFTLILWRGFRIAVRVRDSFLKLCSAGFMLLIVVQAFMNMSVVLSLAPNKGIPLPFISYGSSSLIATLATLGLLLSISKETSA